MMTSKRLLAVAVSAALYAPLSAYATNGMNLEGYGAIASGMGGASMAYDNGTAAMMNNPATLGLMAEGNSVDVALGMLGPDVEASHPMSPTKWSSDSDAFYMPAFGWAKKNGKLTYGVGAFAQGGMGTEYKDGGPGTGFVAMSIAAPVAQGGTNNPAQMAAVSGWREFSEVGVMRILFPVAYNVDDKLTVGGSIDYVRATMDLQMAMTAGVMNDMMGNPNSTVGKITTTMNLPGLMGMMGWTALNGGYFDFADSNDFGGKTEGSGFAGKIGVTYKASETLTIGATYHSETSLGDLEGDASMQLAGNNGTTASTATVSGKVKIKDFQWPQTLGVGLGYKANDKLFVAADVKQIMWSEVMKDFKMSFTSAMGDLDATMYQNWDDQTVFQLGVAYAATNALTLRAGANLANNPIPDSTVHYLFPAIVENHYTAGLGYKFSDVSDVNFSLSYAPEVEVTGTNSVSNQGLSITHAQTSWQMMYSHRF